MKILNSIILILVVSLLSSPSWSEPLILKCVSRKYQGDDWIGNITYFQIDFETKRVAMNEINDETRGWLRHKLTDENDLEVTIKSCQNSNCSMVDANKSFKTYIVIDRITGILRKIADYNDYKTIQYEYQCDKTDKLF